MRAMTPVLAALAATPVVASLSAAQSPWTDRRADKAVGLEIFKPDFDGPNYTTFTTSMAVVFLRLPAAPRVVVVAEVPLAHYGEKFPFGGNYSDNALGNPYLGLEVRTPDDRVSGEFGLRLPTASDNQASSVGAFADADRLDAFARDVLPVTAVATYRYRSPTGFVARLRAGPSLWIDAGDRRSETDLVLFYSGQLGYEGRGVSFLGGASGLMVLTEEGADLGERTLHQLGMALALGDGRFRPGVQIRLPLDHDLTDVLDVVFGLSLTVALPERRAGSLAQPSPP